jgi:hypothetical protein
MGQNWRDGWRNRASSSLACPVLHGVGSIPRAVGRYQSTPNERGSQTARRAVRNVDKQVPYLSPAEQKWLDGELNSGNGKITDRYIRATDSQEYAVSTAKSGFALVLIPLNNLSSLKMACKDEVRMWAEVASRLPDTRLWQAVDHLVERKIVSKKSAEDFGNSFLANATLRSQAILNAVVIPYLRGDLNCQ